ncbi:MAG: ParB/RepB/Spo0J family partition protein [Candidatus Kerfeldbacteria bacterium]
MTSTLGRGLSSLIPNASAQKRWEPIIRQEETDLQRVLKIPTSSIMMNPHQPRKGVDHTALEELIDSIREHGILQPLIVVRKGDRYQLIAGERRLRSAAIIGLPTVPAIVRDATTQEQLELAIVENVQRKDLNPMERAFAYRKLIDDFGLTQDQVAKRVGKSRVTVANTIRLLELPEDVQRAVAEEKLSEGHAKVIAGASPAKEQLRLFKQILEQSLSVRGGERLARAKHGSSRFRPADPDLVAVEEELRERFGTRVRADRKGKTGTIIIEFYSDEEFRALVMRLRRA